MLPYISTLTLATFLIKNPRPKYFKQEKVITIRKNPKQLGRDFA